MNMLHGVWPYGISFEALLLLPALSLALQLHPLVFLPFLLALDPLPFLDLGTLSL
jgi:hypothetical protein